MKLEHLHLQNFRCFKSLDLDFHPRLTVLVANNGEGKTTVLDAIAIGLGRLLQHFDSAAQRLPAPELVDMDFRRESRFDKHGKLVPVICKEIRVSLAAHGFQSSNALQWDVWKGWTEDQQPSSPMETDTFKSVAISIRNKIYDGDDSVLVPVLAYYGTERGFVDVPGRIRQTKGDYSQRLSGLADALFPELDFPELLRWFKEEHYEELKGFAGDEPVESSTLRTIRIALQLFFDNKVSNPRFEKNNKFTVDFINANGHKVPLLVEQLSQGYQTTLALALDFARRMELLNPSYHKNEAVAYVFSSIGENGQEKNNSESVSEANDSDEAEDYSNPAWLTPLGAPAVMLIDEVDLHLHPTWQQRVLPDLMRTFPNTQFIVTTHSPQVLTTVHKENIRILGLSADGVGTVEIPTEQTMAVTSADILPRVMETEARPPSIKESQELARYNDFIDHDRQDSEEAQKLRAKLIKHFGERSPEILECDRVIRFRSFIKKNKH